jgi:hypothetical protein
MLSSEVCWSLWKLRNLIYFHGATWCSTKGLWRMVEMLESPHTGESLGSIGRCDQLPGSQGVAAWLPTDTWGTTSDDDDRGANLMRLERLKYTRPFKLKLLDTFM